MVLENKELITVADRYLGILCESSSEIIGDRVTMICLDSVYCIY